MPGNWPRTRGGQPYHLFLYRITVNEHSRQSSHLRGSSAGVGPLGLDLHYLMSAWGMTAQDEQVALTWALRQLHQYPVLDASSLAPDAGWASDEVIQIVPSELATEDVMRIWDALTPHTGSRSPTSRAWSVSTPTATTPSSGPWSRDASPSAGRRRDDAGFPRDGAPRMAGSRCPAPGGRHHRHGAARAARHQRRPSAHRAQPQRTLRNS